MHLQEKFFKVNPGGFFLDETDPKGIEIYLADKNVMDRISTAARVYGIDEGIRDDREEIVMGF